MLRWDNALKWKRTGLWGGSGGLASEFAAGPSVKLQALKSSVLLQVSGKENGPHPWEQVWGYRVSLEETPIPGNEMWSRFQDLWGRWAVTLLVFFKIFIYFIYLFLAALGLCCCTWAFSSCGERGLFIVLRGLLVAVASLVAKHRL